MVKQRWPTDCFFFFQAEDGIRDGRVTGVQTCALPICEQVIVHLVSGTVGSLTAQVLLEQRPSERFLIVPANIYCDSRLLAALCAKDSSAALIDSNPPEFARSLVRNP